MFGLGAQSTYCAAVTLRVSLLSAQHSVTAGMPVTPLTTLPFHAQPGRALQR